MTKSRPSQPLQPLQPSQPLQPLQLDRLPALDGLRGLAVVAVLCYHAGFTWAKGGWLGVSVFFTLSGYLITSLLLREWANHGRIALGAFWSRRARRLLPAALLTLAGVSVLAPVLSSSNQLHHLRFDVLASVGYVANWRFLFAHTSYADLFSAPSPVQHFWSLAVEEQFYLVYPLAVYAALRIGGRRLLAAVLATGALASLLWSLHLQASVNRVYYGTDTRVAELLAGGLLALSWYGLVRARPGVGRGARRVGPDVVGFAALAGTLACCATMAETSHWVTRGLLPLQAVLSVAVIAAATRPGLVARALAWRPLAAIGLVSYGLYLYHWPVFLALSPERTHLAQIPCFVLRVLVTATLAWCSYVFLEQPVRRRRVLTGRLVLPIAVGAAVSVAATAIAVTVQVPRSNLAYANVRVGGGAVSISRTASASLAASRLPPVSPPSSIMIIGDSAMFDASLAVQALYQRLGTTTVVNASFPGFGLTVDPAGWHRTWPGLVQVNRPQVIIAMLGGWDIAYVKAHGAKAYESVLDDATRVLTAAGGRILWLGMPPTDAFGRTKQVDLLMQATVREHPHITAYADPAPVLRGSDGTAPRWLTDAIGELVLARKPDGWHFCPDGAVRVAEFAAAKVAQLGWSPAPRPGWEAGSWRSDHRYDNPPGGCDPTRPQNAPPPRA